MAREEVERLVGRILDAQQQVVSHVVDTVEWDNLGDRVPDDGFTVQDVLRMWVWHFWSHHRELVRARGSLAQDNPHFHVPHFVRQASEECGRFVGELACLTDDQLDLPLPDGDRTIREIVQHMADTLETFVIEEAG